MLVPEFNKYPKPTDWNSLYILAQQAFEEGFRAFTMEDLINFLDSGGQSLPPNIAPFKCRLGDGKVSIVGDDTVISDSRLLGLEDYPVNCTQLNNAFFRDSELAYNPNIGSVTLLNFHLQSGEVVAVFPAVGTGGSGNPLQPLIDRIVALERMSAPLLGGGRMLWTRPIDEIPAGWEIDTEWNKRVPVGYDPTDPDFNTIGNTGGAKDVKLSANQQGEIEFQFQPDHSQGSSSVRQISGVRAKPRGASSWSFSHEVAPPAYQWSGSQYVRPGEATESHTNMPPYRVGCWIKYVGV